VKGRAVDFEIGISNTNHAVKESDAVVVDFKDSSKFLTMSRDEGCKWPVMFMGFKLTPTSGFEKPVETVDQRVDDEPIEMQENFQVFQNGTMVIPGAKTMFGYAGPNGKAKFIDSDDGGQYVSLSAKSEFELHYQISPEVNWIKRKKYLMSMELATFKSTDPVVMTVQVISYYHENNEEVRTLKEYKISIPYTKDLFQMTAPIEIDLGGGIEDFVLTIPSGTAQRVAIKELRFAPADGEYGFRDFPETIPSEIPSFPGDRGPVTIDSDTGIITVPPVDQIRHLYDLGMRDGWGLYDSIYGDTNVLVFFADGFSGFRRKLKLDWKVELDSMKYAVSMVYRTLGGEVSDPEADNPIEVSGNTFDDFEIKIFDTKQAVKESDPVVVDFKPGGNGVNWVSLSRAQGCKRSIMFIGFKLTPFADP